MASLTRREFLFLGAAAGAGVASGVIIPLSRMASSGDGGEGLAAVAEFFPRTSVGSLSSLSVGQPVMFDYPQSGQASILVKLGAPTETGIGPDSDIVAFSRICTHMGCVIDDFQADSGVLGPCPCHFTTFDVGTGGQVILGQATQNLPQVLLEEDGDDIVAAGVVRLVYGYNNTLEMA